MMIDKETAKIEIPSDGFYESISTEEDTDYLDEIALFQNSLLG